MAGDWIKVDIATPDKPEIDRMASLLKLDHDSVLGKCIRVWIWADLQSVDGNALIVTESFLDRLTYCHGFAAALRQVGWLSGREGRLMIPNFDRHNGQTAKNRALTGKRVQKSRNAATVTKTLPEKRREEKINNIGGRPSEITIPASLNDPECIAAAERWLDYLDSKQLQDKSPRGNELAIEAWWQQMARLGRAGFLEAVVQSMAAGRWNVELKQGYSERGKRTDSKDWLAALKAAKTHPGDWQKRKDILGDDLFEALKRTGSKAVAESNDFEQKTLRELFESHLKDIRSGIKTSN